MHERRFRTARCDRAPHVDRRFRAATGRRGCCSLDTRDMCATALTAAMHAANLLTRVLYSWLQSVSRKPVGEFWIWCRRDCVRSHEIHSRPFVSIYRELQHGPAENVRKNPPRPFGRRAKSSAGDRGPARQGLVDRQKDSDGPVTKRVLRLGLRWQLRVAFHGQLMTPTLVIEPKD